MTAGPRANGTAVLPDGRLVTPYGRTTTVDLLPTNLVLSHDGKRLDAIIDGIDSRLHDSSHSDKTVNRFVTPPDTMDRGARSAP